METSKLCSVCGDKALNYNFNAVTCESCKAFFRRNALVNKFFKCHFEGNCDITPVTRRFCQKCRLDKCFSTGMQKHMIMSEKDKELKRKKIAMNKAMKRSSGFGFKKQKKETVIRYNNNTDTSDDCNSNASSLASLSPEYVQAPRENYLFGSQECLDSKQSILHSLISSNATTNHNLVNGGKTSEGYFIHVDVSEMRKSTEEDVTRNVMEEVQQNPIEVNSIESILCEAIKLEYDAYSTLTSSRGSSRELNDAERAKLNELIVANKALLTPVDEDLSNFIAEDCNLQAKANQALLADPALVDVINLTAVAIRRLIKMAKKINAFKNMCQEDQVALLKGGCTEMMILRSAMNYDSSKKTWTIPHSQEGVGNLKTDILKQAKGNVYEEHEKFIKTFDCSWRQDENIILIMCAISLFTPDRSRVVHQDVIKLEQNSYYYLLRRYLESVFPGCEAKSTFLKLIQKIVELHRLNEEVTNCYLDVNPSDVEPLLIEIFDLKH